LGDFNSFWQRANKIGLISNYSIYTLKHVVTLFSPFHKFVKKSGDLVFREEKNEETFFTNLVKNQLAAMEKVEIPSAIKMNPIIVPLIFEFERDYVTPKRIWLNLKKRLGEKAWDYIASDKIRRKRQDGSAISYVQKVFKFICENYDSFFLQNKIAFGPLYAKENNVNPLIILELKNPHVLIKLLEQVCAVSAYLVFGKTNKTNEVILDFLTNSKELLGLLDILPDFTKKHKLIYLNYHKSQKYWHTENWMKLQYHKLFNPKETAWCFETKEYLSQLELLSPAKR
jgi:hypothetical protein